MSSEFINITHPLLVQLAIIFTSLLTKNILNFFLLKKRHAIQSVEENKYNRDWHKEIY